MIDITPTTDSDTQVTEGDKVRVSWLLDAQADPNRITLRVASADKDETFSGDELTEELVEQDGERRYRYRRDFELASIFTQVEWRLSDPINKAADSASIQAHPRI
jgi:hypothetical protein